MKFRKPDQFEVEISAPCMNALEGEVLIPFQTVRLAKAFRARAYDFKRSHRAHRTDLGERLSSLSIKLYTTVDVRMSRPNYNPGPLYPYTIILDGRKEFESNVANMVIVENAPVDPPVRTTIDPAHYVAPPLEDDTYEYVDDGDDRANVFANILGNMEKPE
jgi:hypothetical protein